MPKRAFVIVIDACGAGELPDSGEYGDAGANTLGHVAEAAGGLDLPVLERLGLGNIMPLVGVAPAGDPVVHGRLRPLGPGKDTITGHWELMGVVTPVALRTYPDGFPPEVIDALRDATGRGVLCNRPSSGTAVIDDFGEQHLATGVTTPISSQWPVIVSLPGPSGCSRPCRTGSAAGGAPTSGRMFPSPSEVSTGRSSPPDASAT